MRQSTRLGSVAAAVGLVVGGSVVAVLPADAHTSGIHDNCTKLHERWEHGVGRRGAHDRTTSGDPVRNWTRNTKAYRAANRHNGTLDADNDGIACEAH
jgi:hypothetical protein